MVNSEAVAHTPQPHIGEAYVGVRGSISTMYRRAVPITEQPPADNLEGGIQTPQRHYAPVASLCPELRAIVGLGVCKERVSKDPNQ